MSGRYSVVGKAISRVICTRRPVVCDSLACARAMSVPESDTPLWFMASSHVPHGWREVLLVTVTRVPSPMMKMRPASAS